MGRLSTSLERALKHRFGLQDIFDGPGAVSTPIVLFSYFNPLLQFGETISVGQAD